MLYSPIVYMNVHIHYIIVCIVTEVFRTTENNKNLKNNSQKMVFLSKGVKKMTEHLISFTIQAAMYMV